jgi:hypothetical protein
MEVATCSDNFMENSAMISMQTARALYILLGTAGTLFILAMAFDLLSLQVGLFLGISCWLVAGVVWGFVPRG